MFAYWEHEVISTSLVSLLGSGPNNCAAIAVLFTSVLKVQQIVSFPLSLMFTRTPTTVPMRHGRSAHWPPHTRTPSGGGLSRHHRWAYPPHTPDPEYQSRRVHPLPTTTSPPPAERAGLAEYSRSFQFFRQVCEPPSNHTAPSHSREF